MNVFLKGSLIETGQALVGLSVERVAPDRQLIPDTGLFAPVKRLADFTEFVENLLVGLEGDDGLLDSPFQLVVSEGELEELFGLGVAEAPQRHTQAVDRVAVLRILTEGGPEVRGGLAWIVALQFQATSEKIESRVIGGPVPGQLIRGFDLPAFDGDLDAERARVGV